MNIKYIFTLAVIILASAMSQAQNNLPKTTIGGHQFYYYETGANESIYDIAAKLGVTKDYIIQNNPNAADGIESGMTLYFPVNEAEEAVSAAISHAPSAQIHIVEQGQTLYGLAKKYSITVEDLIAANPGSTQYPLGVQIIYCRHRSASAQCFWPKHGDDKSACWFRPRFPHVEGRRKHLHHCKAIQCNY